MGAYGSRVGAKRPEVEGAQVRIDTARHNFRPIASKPSERRCTGGAVLRFRCRWYPPFSTRSYATDNQLTNIIVNRRREREVSRRNAVASPAGHRDRRPRVLRVFSRVMLSLIVKNRWYNVVQPTRDSRNANAHLRREEYFRGESIDRLVARNTYNVILCPRI